MRKGISRPAQLVFGVLSLVTGIAALRQGLVTLAESAVPKPAAITAVPAGLGSPADFVTTRRPAGMRREVADSDPVADTALRNEREIQFGTESEAEEARPGDTQLAVESPDRAQALRYAVLGQRLLVREARLDPNNLLGGAEVARVSARDGGEGLRVSAVADRSLLASAELEDGDRIVSVNGVDARGVLGQRAALREIASSERWLIEVEGLRGARILEIVSPDADQASVSEITKDRFALEGSE